MKHCMPPQGPAPTRAKQIPLPLPPPHTPQPWTPSSPPPSEMCFPFYHSVLCGGQEPLSGSSGGSGPPLAADAEPISPAVDPGSREVATAAGAALLPGGGTDVGVWGRPSTEGVPWGRVVVPVYAGAWGRGGWDAALPSPACCWVASLEGVRCNVWGQSGALGWGGDPCAAPGESPGAMPPTQQGAAPQQGVPCAVNKAGIQPVLCAPRPAPHPTPAPWALRTQPHCAPLSPPNPPCSPHTLFPTFLSPLSPLGTSFKCPMCPLHPPPFSRCSDPHFFHPHFASQPVQPPRLPKAVPCSAQALLWDAMG